MSALPNFNFKDTPLKKEIFLHLLHNGKSSIPDIAKDMNYSVPTMTKYIAALCKEGFLCDFGKVETKEGRHPNMYGVVPDARFYVGVDVHWFSLGIGIINLTGDLLNYYVDESFRFSNTPQTLDTICERILQFIDEVCQDPDLSVNRSKILDVNVNISGRVNPQMGYSYSIFNFVETPLADVFSEKLGINTTIDNDTRATAYGEYTQIYEGKVKDMVFINVGWGIGVCFVIDGKVYYGKSGFSGEFGHMNVYDNEIMCHCGKKGCLETEISGVALLRHVIDRINMGSESVLSGQVKQGKEINIYDVLEAITEKDDTLCIEVIEDIGFQLGRQIANLINLFNPEVVVVGGLLAKTEDYLLLPIKGAIKKHSLNIISKDTQVTLSKMKEKAGIMGACLLARERNC